MSKVCAEPKPKKTFSKKAKKDAVEVGEVSKAKKKRGSGEKKNVFDALKSKVSEKVGAQRVVASYEPFPSNLVPEAQTSAASESKAKPKKVKKRSTSKGQKVSAEAVAVTTAVSKKKKKEK